MIFHPYYWNLAFLLTHELDAVRKQEWRMLPLLSFIRDENTAFATFTLLHVPIFAGMFYGLSSRKFRVSIDSFSVVHTGLHIVALWCPRNLFNDWVSWILIGGAGLCGAIDLWLLRNKQVD
jgi:hypothetical protein